MDSDRIFQKLEEIAGHLSDLNGRMGLLEHRATQADKVAGEVRALERRIDQVERSIGELGLKFKIAVAGLGVAGGVVGVVITEAIKMALKGG